MEWKTDWGLRGRMLLTVFLLGVLYLVFGAALVWYFGSVVPMLLIMVPFAFVQYFFSDRLALRSMGARKVDEEEYPELHAMVGRLAQQAGVPKPDVAVAESSVPNAFAAGRSPDNSVVCFTTGIMGSLDSDELEGVAAHELAHVKNRDVAVMTIASFLSTVAFIIVRWGWLFGGGRNRQGGGGVIVAVLVSLVVWVVSFLLVRALSRYREFAADRGAAAITGKPSALASALVTISGRMDRVPKEDLRDQAEMNAFFIIPIRSGFIGRIASTHPPTEKRVERLQELERDLETA